jgi:hypothetical protein
LKIYIKCSCFKADPFFLRPSLSRSSLIPSSLANLHIYSDTMDRSLVIYNRFSDKATQTDMPFVETEPLRPQLFVTRQNGAMVPLVAADELPSTISIRGVPRTLSPYDISGMAGVGTFNSRHRQYVVDGLNKGFATPSMAGDKSLMASSFAMGANRPLKSDTPWGMNHADILPTPPKAYGIQEQPPSGPKTPFANMAPSTNEPSAAPVDFDLPPFHNLDELPMGRAPGIKEYCSYWLRHGECDYAQQGCLYRHEMPLDRPTLEKLGLRDIPRWYREKHRLGSYLAGGNTMSGINAASTTKPSLMERNWRSHPAEVLLDGTRHQPDKQAELPTSSTSSPTEQRREKPSTIIPVLPLKPADPTPKPTVSTPKSTALNSKPTYHAIFSPHQPSPAVSKAKAVATAHVPEEETISARQIRETIRLLDAYDQRERDRLAEKYQTLEPQKSGIAVPVNTPSSSTASSTSGGPEGGEVAEEISVVAKAVCPSIKPSSVSTSKSPRPKPASLRPAPVVKRVGKSRRRTNDVREPGVVADGRDGVKMERLVDHD